MNKLSLTELLPVCLGTCDISTITESEWASIILILRHEHFLPQLAKRLLDHDKYTLPQSVAEHLQNAVLLADRQAQQVRFEVSVLTPFLNEITPDFLYLKGAAYTLTGAKVGDGRVYSDIDILVPKTVLSDVERKLVLRGWFSQDIHDYDDKYYREWAHEIPPLTHSLRGTTLDIHHNIVPLISRDAPDVSPLVKTMRLTKEGHPVLSEAAMFLHSAVHLFFNEDFKHSYRDLFDLYHIACFHTQPDFWEELSSLSIALKFEKEVFLALRYVERVLGVKVVKNHNGCLYSISRAHLLLLDFIFERALQPKHPLCKVPFQSTALFLAWCRGHWCKMPIHILVYHLSVKSFRGITEYLFGKHVFIKEQKKEQR